MTALLAIALITILLVAFLFMRGSDTRRLRTKIIFLAVALLAVPLALLWVIAGSDRLFTRTVPLEQRLVSHNETIRKRAEQELLGLPGDAKRDVTGRLIPLLEQDDPFQQKWAAIAIALMGPSAQEAIPVLLRGVSSPHSDVAQACRVALSEIGTPDVQQLPSLLQALADTQPAVRCEAAASLAKMGPPALEALPMLIRRMQLETEGPGCVTDAVGNLVSIVPDAVPAVIELVQASSATVRRNGIVALGAAGSRSPEAIHALLDRLADDANGEVRRAAATSLGIRQVPERGRTPSFIYAARKSSHEEVRKTALEFLRKGGVPLGDLRTLLMEALNDSSAAVRLTAMTWLRDEERSARFAISAVVFRLRDSQPEIRRMALEVLERSGTRQTSALRLIALAQRDSDASVRCLAARNLVVMGAWDRVNVSMLMQDLQRDGESGDCAGRALASVGQFSSEVVPAVMQVLRNGDREARARAAFVLMNLGARSREALPLLAQAAKDRVPGADIAAKSIRQASEQPRRKRRR